MIPQVSSGLLPPFLGSTYLDLCVVSSRDARPFAIVEVVNRIINVEPGYKNHNVRTLTPSNKAVSPKKIIRTADGRMLLECLKNIRTHKRTEQTAEIEIAASDAALRMRDSNARTTSDAN